MGRIIKTCKWWIPGLVAFSLFLPISGVYAVPISVGDYIKFSDGPGNTAGGEFIITSVDGTYSFTSFCIETNEYINFSSEFKVDSISTAAYNGGSGGGTPDPLDPKTAYLYYMFATNQLSGYDYGIPAQRIQDANSLQLAIWYLEGEITSLTDAQALAWIDEAAAAIASGNWSGLGNVRVLNISYANPGTLAQSQLVLVPEPSTLLLLGAGLLGLGLLGRKKFKAKG